MVDLPGMFPADGPEGFVLPPVPDPTVGTETTGIVEGPVMDPGVGMPFKVGCGDRGVVVLAGGTDGEPGTPGPDPNVGIDVTGIVGCLVVSLEGLVGEADGTGVTLEEGVGWAGVDCPPEPEPDPFDGMEAAGLIVGVEDAAGIADPDAGMIEGVVDPIVGRKYDGAGNTGGGTGYPVTEPNVGTEPVVVGAEAVGTK